MNEHQVALKAYDKLHSRRSVGYQDEARKPFRWTTYTTFSIFSFRQHNSGEAKGETKRN